jgi:glycerol-3-phosphate dehydrogenase (NAD(P)+)
MKVPQQIAVLGGGSWATALVKILTDNQIKVHWYIRNQNDVDYLIKHRHNPKYLTSVHFDLNMLELSSDLNQVVDQNKRMILAIPSAFVAAELSKLKTPLNRKTIFSAVKGIEPESELIIGEYLHQHFEIPMNQIGVITGPCHAEEVALERLSYLTIACLNKKRAQYLASMLSNEYILTNTSRDVFGTEYAAVFKNIYALAAGIANGIGYGDNFQAVLIANAVAEMKIIIKAIKRKRRVIYHSAYLGDLLVTAYSTFSRNRMFGTMIGKGYTVKSAMIEMKMVAEGYYASKSAHHILKRKELFDKAPIAASVYRILYNGERPRAVFKELQNKLV